MNIHNSRISAVAIGATLLLALGGAGGAFAAGQITGHEIKNGTITSADVANGGLGLRDLNDYSQNQINKPGPKGDTGAPGKDGAAGPAGPAGPAGSNGRDGQDGKDGVTNLIAGAGYTNHWAGDAGASVQTSRAECPAGQYALGGGYSTWGGDKDLGGDNKNIQVTVSAPYFEGEYKPVDEAGNFRPTEWVVKGFNNGNTDQIVRAWVTCAEVSISN